MTGEAEGEEAEYTCTDCGRAIAPVQEPLKPGWFWARLVQSQTHGSVQVVYFWPDGWITDRRGRPYHAGHFQIIKRIEEPKKDEFPGFEPAAIARGRGYDEP